MTTDEMIAALEALPGCTNWQMQADCDHDTATCEYSFTAFFSGTSHFGTSNDSLEGAYRELLETIKTNLAPTRGLLARLDELSGVSTVRIQPSD